MFDALKKEWRRIKSSEPGRRFQDQFERKKDQEQRPWKKPLMICVGVTIIAAGIFFLPMPGPGFLIILVGAAMVARQSLVMARFLDWSEVRLRRLFGRLRELWRKLSIPGRIAFCAMVLAVLLPIGWFCLQFMLKRLA